MAAPFVQRAARRPLKESDMSTPPDPAVQPLDPDPDTLIDPDAAPNPDDPDLPDGPDSATPLAPADRPRL